jgi:thioredoxin 1
MDITSQTFQSEVLDFKGKVLVDFWAPWCGPCQMLAPVIEEVATELSSKVKLVKINVDTDSQLASSYNVGSIPTVLLFDNGQLKASLVGSRQKQEYVTAVNK